MFVFVNLWNYPLLPKLHRVAVRLLESTGLSEPGWDCSFTTGSVEIKERRVAGSQRTRHNASGSALG